MKGLLLLLACCYLMSACKNNASKQAVEQENVLVPDTLLYNDSAFLFYEKVPNGKYLLTWGRNADNPVGQDTLGPMPKGLPTVRWQNAAAICIEGDCGSACTFAYILPLEKLSKSKHYLFPLSYNPDQSLICYSSNRVKDKALATVENYITGKQMQILLPYFPGTAPYATIDSVSFVKNNQLYIEWKHITGKKMKKTIPIKLK
ncbi:hypothetical protein LX64_01898 [Chitinophaga skermanii]|uniref:Lipoprotein n=1 Tax=Chitinophaga skermanii TaxID=331697 RepID=A0A327QR96_9BACT|nr:hypothetical protein [Chitinophaga skermanii]RAJ06771.1 hypothetical protein LX64_01898 [Chitinophaga skermanii]